ncbi:hypothetical protein CXR04_01800 [Streptomyces sp. CMB-StM0423]|nr:hypothetical protein CXR04_01800 [Streptomyces sp. CMB-StM0423]
MAASACAGQDGDGGEVAKVADQSATASPTASPSVRPGDFTGRVDNPFLAFAPGTKFTYDLSSGDGNGRDVVEVTHQTKKILGVTTTVVRDRTYIGGSLVEDSHDWLAQDRDGTVWTFGEDSKTIKNGKVVSTEGSWQAGKKGAEPGIAMLADPKKGKRYVAESAPKVVEIRAEVLSRNASVTVPFASYRNNALEIKETNSLEPNVVAHRFYAKGVGLVSTEVTGGGGEKMELVRVKRP